MARTTARKLARQRGEIEQLPSGSLRVKVYAGIDPLTKKRHYLREVIPAGPTAATEADGHARRPGTAEEPPLPGPACQRGLLPRWFGHSRASAGASRRSPPAHGRRT